MARGWIGQEPARIVVTGCSSGIGRSLCALLTGRGHIVIATARDRQRIADVEAEQHIALDVTDAASVAAAHEAIGEVDVLVNNAGVTVWGPVEMVPVEVAQRVFDTNVWGAIRMVQAFAPNMRARGRGRIVNVSTAALRGHPLLGVYAASKNALETASESLRLELAPFGVDLVLAQPGGVDSGFAGNRLHVDPDGSGYERLVIRAREYLQSLRGEVLSSDQVAAAIADVIESDDPPLRLPIGDESRRILAQRRSVSDAEFETFVTSQLT